MKRICALSAVAALSLVGIVSTAAAHGATTAASSAVAPVTIRASAATYTPTAQPAPPSCPYQYVCGYTGPNYTGSMGALIGNNADLTQYPVPWEHVDSIYNNGVQCEVWMYRWKNYVANGHDVGFRMQTGFTNLKTQAPGLYDHTWSNHWCTNT